LGLTPEHELVIHCWCVGCKRDIYLIKPLTDCWRECPKPEDPVEPLNGSTARVRQLDAEFLRSLGVRFPDESKC